MVVDLSLTLLASLSSLAAQLIDQLPRLPLAVLVSEPGQIGELVRNADAITEINSITRKFIEFGQKIAGGICALAILAGFIMIGTSHGNHMRAENGRQAIIAGLTGLVGVALVTGLVEVVTGTFSVLK